MEFYREVTDNMITEAIGTMMTISSQRKVQSISNSADGSPFLLSKSAPDNNDGGRSYSETTPSALRSELRNSDVEFHKTFMRATRELVAFDYEDIKVE